MKITIKITSLRIILLCLATASVVLAASIIGAPVVGHRGSDLIGYIDPAIIQDNTITSEKIMNYDQVDPLATADFSDGSFPAVKFPDNVISSDNIKDQTLTPDKFMPLTDDSIGSVQWTQISDSPESAEYGGFGYFLDNTTCLHGGITRMLEPVGLVIVNRVISARFLYLKNESSCTAGKYSRTICERYFKGVAGFTSCDCRLENDLPC